MAPMKGFTNNPLGRPKGSKNKVNIELREEIGEFLRYNWPRIKADFHELEPEKRIGLFEKLLQYALPKMTSTDIQTNYEKLTDAQLEDIVEKLKSTPE
jgi:hypothetical protein